MVVRTHPGRQRSVDVAPEHQQVVRAAAGICNGEIEHDPRLRVLAQEMLATTPITSTAMATAPIRRSLKPPPALRRVGRLRCRPTAQTHQRLVNLGVARIAANPRLARGGRRWDLIRPDQQQPRYSGRGEVLSSGGVAWPATYGYPVLRDEMLGELALLGRSHDGAEPDAARHDRCIWGEASR